MKPRVIFEFENSDTADAFVRWLRDWGGDYSFSNSCMAYASEYEDSIHSIMDFSAYKGDQADAEDLFTLTIPVKNVYSPMPSLKKQEQ